MRDTNHYKPREKQHPAKDLAKLRALKKENQWTIKELAVHVGVSRATIERWFAEDCY